MLLSAIALAATAAELEQRADRRRSVILVRKAEGVANIIFDNDLKHCLTIA